MTDPIHSGSSSHPDSLGRVFEQLDDCQRIIDLHRDGSERLDYVVYTQIWDAIQKIKSKLRTGVNGYPRFAADEKIFDDDTTEEENN